jgi:hypothetical protein
MIATQVYVLAMRAQRTEYGRQDEFGRRVLITSNGRKFLGLQHAEHLALDVDYIRHNFRFQQSDFAKIIDECNRWSQIRMSVRRQLGEYRVATAII